MSLYIGASNRKINNLFGIFFLLISCKFRILQYSVYMNGLNTRAAFDTFCTGTIAVNSVLELIVFRTRSRIYGIVTNVSVYRGRNDC